MKARYSDLKPGNYSLNLKYPNRPLDFYFDATVTIKSSKPLSQELKLGSFGKAGKLQGY